jgi:adenosylcobinamide amidohydrolase
MIIGEYYQGIEIHRDEKIIAVKFTAPHRVLSTCPVNGGLREDLNGVFNHQSCEPQGHFRPEASLAFANPPRYMRELLNRNGLEGPFASLNTAANMHCAAIESSRFRDQEVVVACTAGVESNAGRAGDPASVLETNGNFEALEEEGPPAAGTINIILCINRELTPAAMAIALITATEAKAAALADLNVNSRYSNRIATGTGTDQMAVAARLGDAHPLTGAGKHNKLGEIIGRTVISAIKRSLALQNSLTPLNQRSLKIHIERLGCNRQEMLDGVCRHLNKKEASVLRENFGRIDRDPVTVAAGAALVHMFDKLADGILPESCQPEILATFGAHLSAAVSGKFHRVPAYRETLSGIVPHHLASGVLEYIYRCLALGFKEKWL